MKPVGPAVKRCTEEPIQAVPESIPEDIPVKATDVGALTMSRPTSTARYRELVVCPAFGDTHAG